MTSCSHYQNGPDAVRAMNTGFYWRRCVHLGSEWVVEGSFYDNAVVAICPNDPDLLHPEYQIVYINSDGRITFAEASAAMVQGILLQLAKERHGGENSDI